MQTSDNPEQPAKAAKKLKAAKEPTKPVHTIHERGVVASIWRRQTPTGYQFFEFSLTRAWKSQTSGRTGYSQSFFASNGDQLSSVVAKAAEWIRNNSETTTLPTAGE